jgi:hypothetical protein|uniref:Uncharacterized protein n=1 Tax=Zea mays TaxID=4577 RepID=A0A804MEJ7_MAIZE
MLPVYYKTEKVQVIIEIVSSKDGIEREKEKKANDKSISQAPSQQLNTSESVSERARKQEHTLSGLRRRLDDECPAERGEVHCRRQARAASADHDQQQRQSRPRTSHRHARRALYTACGV